MAQLFANNAYGVLAGTVNGAATLLVLVSGQGARFPAPTGGDHFLATLVGLDGNGAESGWEIVKCTGRSTDQLTVVRAQEGTTATTWNAGTRIELRWTKAGVDGKENAGVAVALDTAHTSAPDPHPQYTTTAEAAAAAPVQSVAGKTGTITLVKADVGLGNVDNTTDANKPISTATQTALNLKANLVSPTFTGTPAAPTAAVNTNTTQLATTAFVNAEIANDAAPIAHVGSGGTAHANVVAAGTAGFMSGADKTKLDGIAVGAQVNAVTSVAAKTGAVVLVKADVGLGNVDNTADAAKPVSTAQQTALNLKAPLASPALTGVPTAPTAAGGTNTTQLATTAFVQGALDAKASFVWGAVRTSVFTAVNGGVYACNTSAGAFVASLPANPQPGWVATFLDYAGTFDASPLTISRNGSNIGGVADDYLLDQKNIGRNFVYADSTKGWLVK